MPTLTVEQAIEQFNSSAVQAVQGCGTPNQYKVTESNSRILVTHPDGCRLDVPFEVIGKMSPEQHLAVFGGLTLTDEHTELMAELRGEMSNDLAPDAPLPEVTIDRDVYTAATGSARFAAVRVMVRESGLPFATLSAKELNKRVTKKARGKIFIKAMKSMGVIMPADLALPVGDVLHAMYSKTEAGIDDSAAKIRRITEAHHETTSQLRAEVAATADAVAALDADVAKTLALREAAIAWRTNTGSPEDKLRAFNRLMDSIDRVTPEPPAAPSLPDLDATFPPADLLAQFEAEEAAREPVPSADNETPR